MTYFVEKIVPTATGFPRSSPDTVRRLAALPVANIGDVVDRLDAEEYAAYWDDIAAQFEALLPLVQGGN